MHLTQQTDYALRVLIYAAVNDDDLVNIATIAHTYQISKSHLMKVVTALVKGGFLHSVRGKGGGLRLARSAEEISLGAVVRYMEPLNLTACLDSGKSCKLAAHCRLTGILLGGMQAFLTHLDRYNLADVSGLAQTRALLLPKKS